MPIGRGEIYFVELDPVVGHEIGGNKKRPVVVLSINFINRKPLVVTVVPGTKATEKTKDYLSTARVLASADNGLAFDTMFQCHQLRALDHSRFPAKPIGSLSAHDLEMIEEAVKRCLGLVVKLPGDS